MPDLPQRKNLRHPLFNYRGWGVYHVTICCQGRIHRFGHVADDVMQLNEVGRIAQMTLDALPTHIEGIQLIASAVMPNHVHLMLAIAEGCTRSLADIVAAYKMRVAQLVRQYHNQQGTAMGQLWQRNYYEHTIRDARDYQAFLRYTLDNPHRWQARMDGLRHE